MVALVNDLWLHLDAGGKVLLILLNLSASFDKIDHLVPINCQASLGLYVPSGRDYQQIWSGVPSICR